MERRHVIYRMKRVGRAVPADDPTTEIGVSRNRIGGDRYLNCRQLFRCKHGARRKKETLLWDLSLQS